MNAKFFDPAPFRRAAGLSTQQAADAVHVARSTWLNWESAGNVTKAYRPRVVKMLRAQLQHRIEVIQGQISRLDDLTE